MIRGNTILENISKLNTFIRMSKSNELLGVYIDKIINNKSKKIKFISDFDSISLDLLYNSLQIMNYKDKVTKESYNKLDKKELKYYLDKLRGMSYFKRQLPSIKNEEILVEYIREALSKGEYVVNSDSTVKFGNGLVIDSEWLVEFTHFLITSLNNNINLSNDGKTYCFSTITIPEVKDNDLRKFIKEIRLFEYHITRKDNKSLTYQNIKYLIDILSPINNYDFKQLQDINSILSKENFTLSINKKSVSFSKEEKQTLEKMLNEEHYEHLIDDFVKDKHKCLDSKFNINRKRLIDSFELLRGLSHAYKCNYSIVECREIFDLSNKMDEIKNAIAIANFYINYIYDEENLKELFNYENLLLEDLKPNIIDYETTEYKNIISELSKLNKKVVAINRKINRCLSNAKVIPKKNIRQLEENSKGLSKNCEELEHYVNEIRVLREELLNIKDENRQLYNINKTKIKYIKESIVTGNYEYDPDTTYLVFRCYSPKDYHCTFELELSLNKFICILLSEDNRNKRINFYQI